MLKDLKISSEQLAKKSKEEETRKQSIKSAYQRKPIKKVKRKKKKKKQSIQLTQIQRQEKEAIKDLLEKGLELDVQPANNPINTLFPQKSSNKMHWLGITKSERKRQEMKIKIKKGKNDVKNAEEFSDSPEKFKISKIEDGGGWKGFEIKDIEENQSDELDRSRTNKMIRIKKNKLKLIGGGTTNKKGKIDSLLISNFRDISVKNKENNFSNSLSTDKNSKKNKQKYFFKVLKHKEERTSLLREKSTEESVESKNKTITIWNLKRKNALKNEMKKYNTPVGKNQWNNRINSSHWKFNLMEDKILSHTQNSPRKAKIEKDEDFLTKERMMQTFDLRLNGFEIHESFKEEMEELKRRRRMYRVKNAFITDENELFKLERGRELKKKIEKLGVKELIKGVNDFTLKDLFSKACNGKRPVNRRGPKPNYYINPTLSLAKHNRKKSDGRISIKKMKEELENVGVYTKDLNSFQRSKSKPSVIRKRSNTLKEEGMRRVQSTKSGIRPLSSALCENQAQRNYKIIQDDIVLDEISPAEGVMKKRNMILDQILVGKRRNASIQKYFERKFGILGTNKRLMNLLAKKEVGNETKKQAIKKNGVFPVAKVNRVAKKMGIYEAGIIIEDCN